MTASPAASAAPASASRSARGWWNSPAARWASHETQWQNAFGQPSAEIRQVGPGLILAASIVGTGELGPYGSARTRFEMEVHDELSAAGVLELQRAGSWAYFGPHTRAWELGIKSLYYLRSKSVQRAGDAGGVEADNTIEAPKFELGETTDYDECLACQ